MPPVAVAASASRWSSILDPIAISRGTSRRPRIDTQHVLYHSDLFLPSFQDLTEEPVVPLTWKIRTCFRHTSWNLWCKARPTLHVDDIPVNDPSYFMDLPELWDFSAAKFTLRNLTAVRPTLSIHGSELVYLVLKVGANDNKAWVPGWLVLIFRTRRWKYCLLVSAGGPSFVYILWISEYNSKVMCPRRWLWPELSIESFS